MTEDNNLKQEYQVALNIVYKLLKTQSKDNETANKLVADLEGDDIERKNKTAAMLVMIFEEIFINAVEYLAFQKNTTNEKETIS